MASDNPTARPRGQVPPGQRLHHSRARLTPGGEPAAQPQCHHRRLGLDLCACREALEHAPLDPAHVGVDEALDLRLGLRESADGEEVELRHVHELPAPHRAQPLECTAAQPHVHEQLGTQHSHILR